MAQVFSEKIIKALPAPTADKQVHYASAVCGFGVRATYTKAR